MSAAEMFLDLSAELTRRQEENLALRAQVSVDVETMRRGWKRIEELEETIRQLRRALEN